MYLSSVFLSLNLYSHFNIWHKCVWTGWSEVSQSCPTLCDPVDCSLPGSSISRQEYWSGLLFPCPGDLPNPGIEPRSPALEADALTSEPPGKPWLTLYKLIFFFSPLSLTSWCRNYDLFICITLRAPETLTSARSGSICGLKLTHRHTYV